MTNLPCFCRFATLAIALTALSARADENLQSLEAIRDAARGLAEAQAPAQAAAEESTAAEAGTLDPRLRLPACAQPLEAFLPAGMQWRSNTTVGVRCNGAVPWTLYVPVRVTITREVAVLAQALSRGAVLTASDVRLERRDIGAYGSGYYVDPAAVVGKVLTRPGNPGQVLNPAMLTGSNVVRRGQQVSLIANAGGVAVRMNGTALADGGVGERVRVRNSASERIVEGVVRDDGSVQIAL